MAVFPRKLISGKPGALGLTGAAICVQLLFHVNLPITALVAFLLITALCFTVRTPTVHSITDHPPGTAGDATLAIAFWALAAGLRLYHLDDFYNISDLTARFTVAALQIAQGIPVFPCIAPFEFDESLISWFYAPFFTVLSPRWITIKTISAILNTLLVPIAYGWLRHRFSRQTACIGASLLALSGYFQYCDPLISMSRFSFIAMTMLLLLICLEKLFTVRESPIWMIPSAILGAVAVYMHSTGRMAIPLIAWLGLKASVAGRGIERNRMIRRTAGTLALLALLFLPFILFTMDHPAYYYFKKRQIYGLHEAYPFSWQGLMTNGFTVFTNFNYRAVLHMHFKDAFPLLRPVTGIGVIGFLWLVTLERDRRRLEGLPAALFFSLVPLVFITPGHWRGLYFTVPVAILTLGAGIFYSRVIDAFIPPVRSGSQVKTRCRCGRVITVTALLITVAILRVPTFYHGPFSPPLKDMITRLYEDMAEEPDVPHYFSSGIPEMKPGYAIYELLGSAWFSEYGVLDFDPLRVRIDEKRSRSLSLKSLKGSEIRIV
ncbi:MAG TPA: hypothetical protein PLV45_01250, partial [bacterium]|nr:hypothetical protein [bacterium]